MYEVIYCIAVYEFHIYIYILETMMLCLLFYGLAHTTKHDYKTKKLCFFSLTILKHSTAMAAAYCTLDIRSLKSHSMKHPRQQLSLSKPSHNVFRTPFLISMHYIVMFRKHSRRLFHEATDSGIQRRNESVTTDF